MIDPDTKNWLEKRQVEFVQMHLIDVQGRLRNVDEDAAKKLSETLDTEDLIHAIVLRPNPSAEGRFLLVAGAHRLRGHEIVGRNEILAEVRNLTDDQAQAIEEIENLARKELLVFQRVIAVGRFKRRHTADYPSTRAGGDRKSIKARSSRFESFSASLSAKTGRSVRSFEEDAALYEAIGEDTLNLLGASPIADNAAQLKALAELAPDQQRACANRIAAGDFKSVKEWRRAVGDDNGPVLMTPEEEWEVKFVDLWERARPAWRKNILRKIEAGKL